MDHASLVLLTDSEFVPGLKSALLAAKGEVDIQSLILLLPNYSVLIVCDDTKVVGNGVSDCFPFPGQGLVEEPEDGRGELSEIGIKPVVRHMPVHDAP